jgi:hypothetical protein
MCNFPQVQGNQRHCAEADGSVRRTSDSARPYRVFSAIDAEIAEKGHMWTETSSKNSRYVIA